MFLSRDENWTFMFNFFELLCDLEKDRRYPYNPYHKKQKIHTVCTLYIWYIYIAQCILYERTNRNPHTYKSNRINKIACSFWPKAKIIFPHNAVMLWMFSKCILIWTGSSIQTEAFLLNAQCLAALVSVGESSTTKYLTIAIWYVIVFNGKICLFHMAYRMLNLSEVIHAPGSIDSIPNIISHQKHTNNELIVVATEKTEKFGSCFYSQQEVLFFLPYLTISLFIATDLPILHIYIEINFEFYSFFYYFQHIHNIECLNSIINHIQLLVFLLKYILHQTITVVPK